MLRHKKQLTYYMLLPFGHVLLSCHAGFARSRAGALALVLGDAHGHRVIPVLGHPGGYFVVRGLSVKHFLLATFLSQGTLKYL